MPHPNQTQHPFANLALWDHFAEISTNPENTALIHRHIDHALSLLNEFVQAFPKYTLHNQRHIQNIVKLMGDLLGDRIADVRPLECAILLLSAAYHDIGMVFKTQEIQNVISEDNFETFLQKNTGAKLQFESNHRTPTIDLIEWYCRWIHAKRVWKYLNEIEPTIAFEWNGIPFKQQLGYVCESHNETTDHIKNADAELATDFQGQCDLKFCAILLRLADILDFDNTRSPKSVFEYLELDKPKNNSEQVSLDEWEKHLASRGFSFIRDHTSIKLLFSAAPRHPSVEVGIRKFISIIDNELEGCKKILNFCSTHWRNFQLPEKVDTSGIVSNNYKSGNYHFSLSEDKILNLLTGEGLYNDEFVFLRELLQNAIDTSRHREFLEKRSNPSFKAEPITVSYFTDQDGYQWIRVDDYGRGMNEQIIFNHLLKKGESYYNSDKFKLEKLAIKDSSSTDFVPISRFGIGLLSCFIIGDKIEISTKFYQPGESEHNHSFRLSVEGRNGFFVLQSNQENHNSSPMPAPNHPEAGYRQKHGTSIAVRIKSSKEFVGFDLTNQLQKYILCSPVPIHCEGQLIGGNFEELINTPLAKEESIPLGEVFVKAVEELLSIELPSGIFIDIVPINITKSSLDTNLKGQLLFFAVRIDDLQKNNNLRININLVKVYAQNIIIRVSCSKLGGSEIIMCDKSIDSIFNYIGKLYNETQLSILHNYILLSHNGIAIDGSERYLNTYFSLEKLQIEIDNLDYHYHGIESPAILGGIIYLQDILLPNLSVARNSIKSFNFATVANILYTTRVLNKYFSEKYQYFKNLPYKKTITIREIKESKFYENNKEYWDKEMMFSHEEEMKSINIIKEMIKKQKVTLPSKYLIMNNFYGIFACYILQENFFISYNTNEDHLIVKESLSSNDFLVDFLPLLFVDFEDDKKITADKFFNKSHPSFIWYLNNINVLLKDYRRYAEAILYRIQANDVTEENIKQINLILEKLRKRLPEKIAPPSHLNINRSMFLDQL